MELGGEQSAWFGRASSAWTVLSAQTDSCGPIVLPSGAGALTVTAAKSWAQWIVALAAALDAAAATAPFVLAKRA